MSGPEHYRRAEELLNALRRAECSMSRRPDQDTLVRILAEAQVHATLAMAAATALSSPVAGEDDSSPVGMDPLDRNAWELVAGEMPKRGERS